MDKGQTTEISGQKKKKRKEIKHKINTLYN